MVFAHKCPKTLSPFIRRLNHRRFQTSFDTGIATGRPSYAVSPEQYDLVKLRVSAMKKYQSGECGNEAVHFDNRDEGLGTGRDTLKTEFSTNKRQSAVGAKSL
jgi:hypothetical protein